MPFFHSSKSSFFFFFDGLIQTSFFFAVSAHKVAHITAGPIQYLPALFYSENFICTVDYVYGCWCELVFLVNP